MFPILLLCYNRYMETFLQDKRIKVLVLVLLVVVSLLTAVKVINEIKQNAFIGSDEIINKTISVTGSGEVIAISDIASISINLSKEGKTAKEAQNSLNEMIAKSLDYLKTEKVEDKDIKSDYGGLYPKYSYEQPVCYTYPCPTRDPKIVGYTANQTITVKVREVDNASVIRTGLAELGVTNISGPTFSIDDEKDYEKEARTLAIEDARKDAKILAKDLGVKLGKVISYYEPGDMDYGYYGEKSSARMDSAMGISSVPTLPKGENKITSTVTITYEIK